MLVSQPMDNIKPEKPALGNCQMSQPINCWSFGNHDSDHFWGIVFRRSVRRGSLQTPSKKPGRTRVSSHRPGSAVVFGESSLVDTSVDSTLSSLVLQRGRDGRSGRRLCRRRPQGRARKVLYLIRFQCLNTIPNFSHLTVGFLLPK